MPGTFWKTDDKILTLASHGMVPWVGSVQLGWSHGYGCTGRLSAECFLSKFSGYLLEIKSLFYLGKIQSLFFSNLTFAEAYVHN